MSPRRTRPGQRCAKSRMAVGACFLENGAALRDLAHGSVHRWVPTGWLATFGVGRQVELRRTAAKPFDVLLSRELLATKWRQGSMSPGHKHARPYAGAIGVA